ncbi:rod shape-determining protein MreD [Lactococcus protaetiae]|uniref:Rod shape-determining protein MreD n=1 Tax=Lactococcus protaetiae TaxID=2592653 RepID=A0A514Z6I0_9LACT|nr:rod shape-determining protein MreD [Lactococcus protaetiae]MCL2114042.1 rod shape-determining protein MreD [Streptococcaceae bacterium]QDK70209.1 rod shape-determining protein MreD [Lactococcus protaetiae]
MSRFTFQFFSPILLFLLLILDGQITHVLTSLSGGTWTPVSHLFLIFLVYSVTQHRSSYIIILAALLGAVYDSYYLGVYGIATLLFPLIALFVYNIESVIFTNRWTRLFTIIIIVTAFEVFSAIITAAFGLSQLNFLNFVVYQLAPTLLLNIILAAMLQAPLELFYRLRKSHFRYTEK